MNKIFSFSIEGRNQHKILSGGRCKKPSPLLTSILILSALGISPVRAQSDIAGDLQRLVDRPPEDEIARVIENTCPQGEPENEPDFQRDCDAVVNNQNVVPDQVSEAISQVTPDQAGVPTDTSQTSVSIQAQNVGSRLAALRAGVTGISIRELALDFNGQPISSEQLAGLSTAAMGQRGGAASADTGFDFGRLGIFINGTIIFGDKDRTSNQEGFDFDTQGVTAGLDYRFTDNFVLGGAVGYLNNDIDLDADGGELDADGYSFTLYSTYYHADKFYIDGSVTYGYNDYDQERNIRYTLPPTANSESAEVDQTMSADYDSDHWDLTLGAGYEFNWREWTFGPIGQLEYIDVDIDDYREQESNPDADGSGWPVEIDSQDFESFTLSLGGQASYAWSQSWGVLVPQARFEWVHEFEDDPVVVTGRFIKATTDDEFGPVDFAFSADEPDENYFIVGAGLSAVLPRGKSLFVHYQTVLGFEDLDHHSVNAGLRWEF